MGDGTNISQETHEQDKFTRRQLLKMLGAGAVGICLATPIAVEIAKFFLPNSSNEKQPATPTISTTSPAEKPNFPPDLVFTGPAHQYEDETTGIIDRVEKHFGVKIISPKTWGEKGKEQPNLPWGTRDIAYVAQAISQLPPEYHNTNRSPKEILLLRAPRSSSEGAGGGYANRRMILFTSETFDPEAEFRSPVPARLYRNQGNHLRASVVHEWTHSFDESKPDIITHFANQTGWEQVQGKWKNRNPENLIHDGGADTSPSEDLAVSAGIMSVNPDHLPADRKNFFLKEQVYSNWPTIVDYKKKHP